MPRKFYFRSPLLSGGLPPIIDTALTLRLKRLTARWQTRLDRLIAALQGLAETHADIAMAGRTYGQVATPSAFGVLMASWGRPLLHHPLQRDGAASLPCGWTLPPGSRPTLRPWPATLTPTTA